MEPKNIANETKGSKPGCSCYDPHLDLLLFPSEEAAADGAAINQPLHYEERRSTWAS